MRKPVFGVHDQVRYKPCCIATEDDYKLEFSDTGSTRRGIVLSTVAKTKALISCTVTMQLICAFIFAYMQKSRFSHDPAHIIIDIQ